MRVGGAEIAIDEVERVDPRWLTHVVSGARERSLSAIVGVHPRALSRRRGLVLAIVDPLPLARVGVSRAS